MLTLEQLIEESTALPDADKAMLIDKILESMEPQEDYVILREGVQLAQCHIAEVEIGAVQTIPRGTLTGLRGIAKRSGSVPSDDELGADYTDYLIQKYR